MRGHEHDVSIRLSRLADGAGVVSIETNYIGQPPIGCLNRGHLAITRRLRIPRNRVGLLVAPDDAAGRVKQDALVEGETRLHGVLQPLAEAQIQVRARRFGKCACPRQQGSLVFLYPAAFGLEDDLGPDMGLLQAQREQLIEDRGIRLADELAINLRPLP